MRSDDVCCVAFCYRWEFRIGIINFLAQIRVGLAHVQRYAVHTDAQHSLVFLQNGSGAHFLK